MCVKFPPRGLNPGPCSPYPINTYICGVTIVPKVYGSKSTINLLYKKFTNWENMIVYKKFKKKENMIVVTLIT